MDRRGSWRYSTPVLPVLERGAIGAGTRTSGSTGGTGGALLGRSSLMMAQMSIREHASDSNSDSETENEKDLPRERRSTHFSSNPFQVHQERVVVAMVGLPARGKSYISHAIIRYLEFLGCPSKLFNVGDQRRKRGLGSGTSADFFDAANTHAKHQREQLAMDCLEDLLQWLHETTTTNNTNTAANINHNQHSEMNGASGHSRSSSSSSSSSSRRSSGHGRARGCAVGILDATNTTIARRHKVMERIAAEVKEKDPHVVLLFVESITNDPQLLEWNYKMKLSNKDYTGMDPTVALQDFRKRVTKYEQVYESITDQEGRPTRSDNRGTSTSTSSIRYMKLIDAGRELITHGMTGGLTMTQIQRLLGTIHLGPRTIYLVLVGETRNDTQHIVGGDSYLSRQGRQYAKGVAQLLQSKVVAASIPDDDEQQSSNNKTSTTTTKMVYIGTLKRYNAMAKLLVETTDSVPYTVLSLGAVSLINTG